MTLEPSLWGTLPKELLHLVFARLPASGIGQLRVLSKEWKRNVDCKDSDFNRDFYETTPLKMFAIMSRVAQDNLVSVRLYDVQADKWHVFETNAAYLPEYRTSPPDGGLFCIPRRNAEGHVDIVVVNPLTRKKMKLPPPLSNESGEFSDLPVKMVQLTVDRKTMEYKVHVVGFMKTAGGNGDQGLVAQVYDSHIKGWSVVESREGRIIGWDQWAYLDSYWYPCCPCVYNCADGNLERFKALDIAPGYVLESMCTEVINDHLFVLHTEVPPGSTYLTEDGYPISLKYCISEFHVPEKATAWEKLRVHECDPSMYHSSPEEEHYSLSLLACNGFLLVHSVEYQRDYDRVWLYNLSTCAWRNLSEWELPRNSNLEMCEMSWSALP